MMSTSIFQPGDVIESSYVIERIETSSRVAETYFARRTVTRQPVILTCSRFEHAPAGSPLRDSFLANASKLTTAVIKDSPHVIAANITDGVYWVVREHFDDAIPIWDLLAPKGPISPAHAGFLKSIRVDPVLYYWAIIIGLGLNVAQILEKFAKLGIYHGGIDPTRNLVLRSFNMPCLVEAGYGQLFGFDYFEKGNTARLNQAPELRKGHSVTARSDIYAFGIALRVILEHGAKVFKFETPREFAVQLERLYAKNPSKRYSSWEDVASIFEREFDAVHARVEAIEKARRESKAAQESPLETPRPGQREPIEAAKAGTSSELPNQEQSIAEPSLPEQATKAVEEPGSGERPRAIAQAGDIDSAPSLLMPEAPTSAPASLQPPRAWNALTGQVRPEARLSDIVELAVFLAEKVDERRKAGAGVPLDASSGLAEGSEPHAREDAEATVIDEAPGTTPSAGIGNPRSMPSAPQMVTTEPSLLSSERRAASNDSIVAPPSTDQPVEPPSAASMDEDVRASEPEPTTRPWRGSADTAPTPRLPTLPRSKDGGAQPRGEARADISKSLSQAMSAPVGALGAKSIVRPTVPAIRPANAHSLEPSMPAREAERTRARRPTRRIPWAASAAAALLIGIVGSWQVLWSGHSVAVADSVPKGSPSVAGKAQAIVDGSASGRAVGAAWRWEGE